MVFPTVATRTSLTKERLWEGAVDLFWMTVEVESISRHTFLRKKNIN